MRSLVWALFMLSIMATATVAASAETRLLGHPVANAGPQPTCQAVFDPAVSVPCARREPSTPCPYVGPAAGDACVALVNNEMLGQSRAQLDATWEAGANVSCTQGDPASLETQEMCDHVSAFRAQTQTHPSPLVSPPQCQGIAAPDPRCAGN